MRLTRTVVNVRYSMHDRSVGIEDGGVDVGWLNASHEQQCAYVRHLRSQLDDTQESKDAIQQLHYIAYGTWGEVDSIEMLQTQIVRNLSPLFASEVWPVLYRHLVHHMDSFLTT